MKKIMVLLIMVTMVLGFSFSAMAIPQMPDVELTPEYLNVRALIAPFASINVVYADSIFVDDAQALMTEVWLTPQYGIYTNDGTIFGNMMLEAFPGVPIVHEGQSFSATESNLATIEVATNTPIFIDYQWEPGTTWMDDVNTILAVHDRTSNLAVQDDSGHAAAVGMTDFAFNHANVEAIFPSSAAGGYVGVFGDAPDAVVTGLTEETSILQNYQFCTERRYELVVGFMLEKVTHVPAGEYTAQVKVTVSDLGIEV